MTDIPTPDAITAACQAQKQADAEPIVVEPSGPSRAKFIRIPIPEHARALAEIRGQDLGEMLGQFAADGVQAFVDEFRAKKP